MDEKKYTPEQMTNAERLCDVITSVPTNKQPEVIRMVEAMILGVEMAGRLNTASTGSA